MIELVKRLAKPAPAAIDFAEVRFSPLLENPLIVSGELRYAGPASLDRRVKAPYEEETQIRGDSVRVLRAGESVRSFALRRAPELRGLLTGFSALLAGDTAALEREFQIDASGTPERWTLLLTPHDARTRKRLEQIEVHGQDDAPRCLTLNTANDGLSVMLLGAAAQETPAPDVTREAVLARCTA